MNAEVELWNKIGDLMTYTADSVWDVEYVAKTLDVDIKTVRKTMDSMELVFDVEERIKEVFEHSKGSVWSQYDLCWVLGEDNETVEYVLEGMEEVGTAVRADDCGDNFRGDE